VTAVFPFVTITGECHPGGRAGYPGSGETGIVLHNKTTLLPMRVKIITEKILQD
jgi:hypothetical protein